MKIYKYRLDQNETSLQSIAMPADAKVLHVGEQYRELYVWALVNEHSTNVNYKFFVLGTGESIDHLEMNSKFVGSVQMSNGLVWHVFYKAGE